MAGSIKFHQHPAYKKLAPKWKVYKDLCEGDHDVLRKPEYLWMHELEIDRMPLLGGSSDGRMKISDASRIRGIREQRTRYLNLIEPVVSRYVSLYFKEAPIYDQQVLDLFGDDIADVTGTGKSLTSFLMEEVTPALLLFGRPIVLTDSYNVQAGSLQVERESGYAPTFELLNPLSFTDWEIETQDPKRKGQFKWVRCEYKIVEPRISADQPPVVNLYSKILSFQNTTYTVALYVAETADNNEVQWKLVNQNDFAGYPDLPVKSIEGECSWIKDTAEQALKLYNLESCRDNIQYYQAYQRTYVSGGLNDQQKAALAEYTIGFLPDGASVTTIEPANTGSLDQNIERTIANLFKVAFNQNRTVSADSKAVEGADTQQESKEQLAALIESSIESLETLTNNFIKDYAFFKTSNKDFQGKVTFNRDIQVADIDRQIALYQALNPEINKIPQWRKDVLKGFAKQFNLENEDKVIDEIEKSTGQDLTNPTNIRGDLLKELNGDEEGNKPKGEPAVGAEGKPDKAVRG